MTIAWVCQSNLGGDDISPMGKDVDKIREVCLEKGYVFVPVTIIPFSDEININLDNDGPVVFYGSTKWIERIYRFGKWKSGIFFNEASVCSIWTRKYGDRSLNLPNIRTTLGDSLLNEQCELFKQEGMVFIRPDKDNKIFNGQLMKVDELSNWIDKMTGDGHSLLNEPIIISSPVNIEYEYRLFIVRGRVLSGSLYRMNGRLTVNDIIPKNIVDFAEEMALLYSPSDVFVMDVAYLFGSMYVIEVGCFNSAGFYASDIRKIIVGVSEYCKIN